MRLTMKARMIMSLVAVLVIARAASAVPTGDLLDGLEPGPDGMIDVLTVFAHQDDESVYGGGTLLKMKQDPSVRLHILCLTLGDMSEAKDQLGIESAHLGRIRSKELETSAAVYGAEEVIQFQYHDQGLADADADRVIAQIVEVINRVGAEMIITHDPGGVTAHTDHMACSRLTTEAFELSNARRLWYVTFPRFIYHIPFGVLGPTSGVTPVYPEIKVNVRKYKKLKRMALYAHASQKHFSDVGLAMDITSRFNYEYFALGGDK